jgi:serine O-acetyltransferase
MPISNRSDLREYLRADALAFIPPVPFWRPWYGLKYPVLAWTRLMRRTEYVVNCLRSPAWAPVRAIAKLYYQRRSIKLGYSIPLNTFGPGVSIAHWGTIAINHGVRVGANCRIHQEVCLGNGTGGSPQIGNNVLIGVGAKIIGGICLGDNVKVGVNAVVLHSFGDGVFLVGSPARPKVSAGDGAHSSAD